jgi:hypothetical protein
MKSCFLVELKKTDKTLARLTNKRTEKTQINKTKHDITMDMTINMKNHYEPYEQPGKPRSNKQIPGHKEPTKMEPQGHRKPEETNKE